MNRIRVKGSCESDSEGSPGPFPVRCGRPAGIMEGILQTTGKVFGSLHRSDMAFILYRLYCVVDKEAVVGCLSGNSILTILER